MSECPILLAAATVGECARLLADFQAIGPNVYAGRRAGHDVHILITGVGPISTAWALGHYLARHHPPLAVQLGIGGTYTPQEIPLLSVVEVNEEVFADMGATSPTGFMNMQALGFAQCYLPDGQGVYNILTNPWPRMQAVPAVRGLTSGTVAGDATLIAERLARWQPQVESMEGAAFFMACMQAQVPFAQLRCISNAVAPRDKSQWQIPQAITRMQEFIYEDFVWHID